MDTNKKLREYISALADGELPEADIELAQAAMREPDGRLAWESYTCIGDALRAESAQLSPGFGARLAARLAAEPTPLRPVAVPAQADALAAVAPVAVAGADPLGSAKVAGQAEAKLAPGPAQASAADTAGLPAIKRV
ncbi:sigma-E factor negative regulatory protein [Massilia consociata]|uniref:Sigma-E factor negative regulatory protein n=2 Tax=Massilia consociata TaxID=760117 RepID=A0ABV6FA33_9BURK